MRLGIGKCNLDYNPYRKFVQFGDLVFDSETIIENAKYSVNTKTKSTSYSWRNGAYVGFKGEKQFLEEGDVSLQATFDYRIYREEDRKFIKDWILDNVLKPSRLWAIDNEKLIWAWAYLTDYSESYATYQGTFSIDLDFKLPEGTWHIADSHSTFLIPWESCEFSYNTDYRDPHKCEDCCTTCSEGHKDCPSCMSDCGNVEANDSLCNQHSTDVFSEFMKCGHSMKIVYDCNKGKILFGEDYLGTKICKDDICKTVIAGQFWSNTLTDTQNVEVTLKGKFQDPRITINETTIGLKGDYEGEIHFHSDGTVTWKCDDCSKEEEIKMSKLIIEDEFGWTIHHGNNKVIVNGSCDCGMNCVWIKADELTQ